MPSPDERRNWYVIARFLGVKDRWVSSEWLTYSQAVKLMEAVQLAGMEARLKEVQIGKKACA